MEELIVFEWNREDRTWHVSARASADDPWSHFEGSEPEIDRLWSLARDVAAGG